MNHFYLCEHNRINQPNRKARYIEEETRLKRADIKEHQKQLMREEGLGEKDAYLRAVNYWAVLFIISLISK